MGCGVSSARTVQHSQAHPQAIPTASLSPVTRTPAHAPVEPLHLSTSTNAENEVRQSVLLTRQLISLRSESYQLNGMVTNLTSKLAMAEEMHAELANRDQQREAEVLRLKTQLAETGAVNFNIERGGATISKAADEIPSYGKSSRDDANLVSSSLIFCVERAEALSSTAISVAKNHAKMTLDPRSLVRERVLAGMSLLDRKLQEQVGSMDMVPLRAMFAEHCLAPDSNTVYNPPSLPSLACTPKGEFLFVVGEDGIDQEEWKLKGGARPTCVSGSMVEGRNDKSLEELMTAPEVKAANLLPEEVLALRLCSGPQRCKYNEILAHLSPSERGTSLNSYPTTIGLIVSGIKKLSSVAKRPKGDAVYRCLAAGVALPDAFFERDQQGFAWAMDPCFMATSRDETVARKSGEGEGLTVFKILLGKMSLGADIAWYASPLPQCTRL